MLDAGALVALERADRTAWALLKASLGAHSPLVPAPALGQVWRGGAGAQARLAAALAGCRVLDTDDRQARRAGVLLGRAGTTDVVDALVAIAAVDYDADVVTSDPGDLRRLLDALGVRRIVRAV